MSKHSGEKTLLQIFKNIKDVGDYLISLINSKQQPFKVSGVADFTTSTVTNLSPTFAEIAEAYERGDHVFIELDTSQMGAPGHRVQVNVTSFLPEIYMTFETIVNLDGGNGSAHVMGVIEADGSSSFNFVPLVQSSQLGNINAILDNINGEVI